ncbi:MAG: septal ring lytic transglycosylase RlpA family protein [Ignavibacteriales bacterium]|nr:septal ring lytic transglycosylase RlpA family protein [Ignavibacteriales bacterium]MBI3787248.1 septal ring lytic transglycosylase RlpA family protein [Ignavibacteriales bacterium]
MNIFNHTGHIKYFLLLSCLLFVGCASSPRFAVKTGGKSEPASPSTPKTSGESKTDSETKTPHNTTGKVLLTLEGVASYYADEFHGKLTSNGETFDMNSLTAAHRTFPFGTKIRVTNLENNMSVIVRVNDRGPFKEGRIIDLARGAAKEIDLIKNGTARVKLEVLEWGDGS